MVRNTPPRRKRSTVRFQPSSSEVEPLSADVPMVFDDTESGRMNEGNRSRSERAAAPTRKPGRHKGRRHAGPEVQVNAQGEKVLKTYGTTKRSRENPVRLSDGKVHPVTVRKITPPPTDAP